MHSLNSGKVCTSKARTSKENISLAQVGLQSKLQMCTNLNYVDKLIEVEHGTNHLINRSHMGGNPLIKKMGPDVPIIC